MSLRDRLDAAVKGDKGYAWKGQLADTAIKALSAGLDQIAPLVLTPVPVERKANANKRRAKASKGTKATKRGRRS